MVKNIAYFPYPWRQWRVRLAGIYRYAEHAGWHVQVIEHGLTALPVRQALKFWNPDGCIVERSVMELPGFRHSDFGDIPVVYCDANPSTARRPIANVRHDSSETAAIFLATCGAVSYNGGYGKDQTNIRTIYEDAGVPGPA